MFTRYRPQFEIPARLRLNLPYRSQFETPSRLRLSFRSPRPAKLRLPSAKGMLLSTAMIAGAAVLGISGAGGSFATWNGSGNVAASTINAGTLGLTVNGSTAYALSGTAWSSLLPGDVVSQQVTVANTGTTAATVSVSTSAPSGAIDVRVKSGACSGTIAGPSSTTTPTTLAGALAGGASATVCVQVSLTSSATQSQSAPFTMTFVADQVRP